MAWRSGGGHGGPLRSADHYATAVSLASVPWISSRMAAASAARAASRRAGVIAVPLASFLASVFAVFAAAFAALDCSAANCLAALSAGESVVEKLERLAGLLAQGALSDTKFQTLKQRLLSDL